MSSADVSGYVLTVADLDEQAARIGEMWENYNTERRAALQLNEEARRFIYATDIDQTSANILPHKNRTHQPKLTSISDTLQTQYFEASLSMPEFFQFEGASEADDELANLVEAWVRVKLEQKKFRETVGRQLINDFVLYGNCFSAVDFVREKDGNGQVIFQGPVVRRISPLDIVMNPRSDDFRKSIKIERRMVHVADVAEFHINYPTAGFREEVIRKALLARQGTHMDDWVEVLKERGINMDGFGSWSQYFKQDLVELLIYYGDVYDPEAMESKRNRILYVIDRTFVIRDEPNRAPAGFDGLHHAGWRIRADNLWAQGPLDNLVGMQYRIDHLENLKADVFDLIAHPVVYIKGQVEEPESGYAPGAVYYGDAESDIDMLTPDTTALQADNQIELYHRMMEEFAGAPPESRGVRTPGEKTAFEVNHLGANATMMFVDKARNFERMLEGILKECFELILANFDGEDYVMIFNDITGAQKLEPLSRETVVAHGEFTAIGARHWMRRNRLAMELQQFQQAVQMDPALSVHVSSLERAKEWSKILGLEDTGIIQPYIGIKEQANAQAIAKSQVQTLSEETGQDLTDETGGVKPMEPGGTPAPLTG